MERKRSSPPVQTPAKAAQPSGPRDRATEIWASRVAERRLPPGANGPFAESRETAAEKRFGQETWSGVLPSVRALAAEGWHANTVGAAARRADQERIQALQRAYYKLPVVPKRVVRGARGAALYINSAGKRVYLKRYQREQLAHGTLRGCAGVNCEQSAAAQHSARARMTD